MGFPWEILLQLIGVIAESVGDFLGNMPKKD